MQKEENKFTRAKCFDTFAPLGPVIETDLNWRGISVKTRVNGKIKTGRHNGHDDIRHPNAHIIISEVMTLLPGDVIATGTPPRGGCC
ncbi:MAG: fumarylacetoacetate hydrolase family protein [Geovibrio sp.]|nr:fumarylacetoacetate hydrolase family protein [Geovibrio sp.]